MRPITKEDLLKYKCLSGICANPSQTKLMVEQHRMVSSGYRTDLYLLDCSTGEYRRLTKDGHSTAPMWVDDHTALFQTKAKEGAKFMRLNVDSGEIQDAFSIRYPVSRMRRLPDGRFLISAEVDLKKEGLTEKQLSAEADYIVVEEIPFWDNGAGYITRIRQSLFLFDETTGALSRVTPELFQTESWELCGKIVYYAGGAYDSVQSKYNGLYAYDVVTGETKTMIAPDMLSIGWIQRAGERVYFSASDLKQYGNGQCGAFCLLDETSPEGYRRIAENELEPYNTIGSDCRRGGGTTMGEWREKLLYAASEVSLYNLHTIDSEGTIEDLPPFPGTTEQFAVCGDDIYFIGMKNGSLQEIWRFDGNTGAYEQVTRINDRALRDCYVAKPEYCGFVNSDGVKIDGWILKPYAYDPKRSYAGVLSMHGGPRGAWGELFVHEMQMLAGAGYFVFFCNPRGSDARGEAFADLRGKYGDIDYRDFMEFTDHVLARYPEIDEKRLAAIGGSYGGYMANWIVGHTDRFAAVVSQRSFCNPLSDFGYSCIGFTFDQDQFDANPWNDPWKMWDHAPLKYACHAVTPTLFIHSLEDYNCPLPEGLQMFTALKYHGCEAKMCLFKGENHELSRSGKPAHRLRRLSEIQTWIDEHTRAE